VTLDFHQLTAASDGFAATSILGCQTTRLPFCDTYGLKKGGQAGLMVLDSSSGNPLIRAVYLTEFPHRKWWKFM
jgi:hypothetical protein